MLDPIIEFFGRIFRAIGALPGRLKAFILSMLLPAPSLRPDGRKRRLRWISYAVKISFVLFVVAYITPLLWNGAYIRNYDLQYPAKILSRIDTSVPANEAVSAQGGTQDTKTCDRSRLVDMEIELIDFVINQNVWMPSMPQFKIGFFGMVAWQDTPFLDNKAAFQNGVLMALRRTSVELADTIGRVRGTSKADNDLLNARGALQYDSETWWLNPFDDGRPFGPVQPSQYSYSKAMDLYDSYNTRLDNCGAVLDARPDNLRAFLDRVANDMGSLADGLNKRSMGKRYDPRTDTFVTGTGNDRGWFDMRADNLFWEASGLMYAYHGLIQAARVDFAEVEERRQLTDIWDRLEENLADAAALQPTIVSNGRKDGLIMPDHLSVMTQVILSARTNIDEIRDILDR